MGWLGKAVGFAFGALVGGPMGAVFGAAVGHQFDQKRGGQGPFSAEIESAEQYRAQMAFFTALFSVMGYVAKADGRVNEAEIELTRKVMARLPLSEAMRKTAMRLFTEGKRSDFNLDGTLDQLRSECRNSFALLRAFVEIQLELALADGALHAAEERILLRICERLRFSRFELYALKAALEAQLRVAQGGRRGQQAYVREREPTLAESYAALGVSAAAGDEEIRRAYRRLLSRHHPDKLAAAEMPEEKIRLANDKTREIRKAWEAVRKARNL